MNCCAVMNSAEKKVFEFVWIWLIFGGIRCVGTGDRQP